MNRRIEAKACAVARRMAFTILELVLVLSIMAIFSAVAVPRFGNFFAQQRAESAVRRIETDIALARRRAKLTGTQRKVSFDVGGSLYTLPGITDPLHPGRQYEVRLLDPPYEATIVSVDFGGTTEVVFDGFGAVVTGGTVVVEVGAFRKFVLVEDPAQVIEDPIVIKDPPITE